MTPLRDLTGRLLRGLPHVRGKARLGMALGRVFQGTLREHPEAFIRMRDGTRMLVDLRSDIQDSAFWTGEYDYDVMQRLLACLQPGQTALDVGANVGFYALAFGQRLRRLGGGQVLAFEPVRANYERLCEGIRLNGLETVVRAVRTALGEENGEIELFTGDQTAPSTCNAVLLRDGVAGYVETDLKPATWRTEKAPITTLDRLTEAQSLPACHLVKVDVEGAELLFLRGAAGYLSRHRPVIYGEFNPTWMRQFGHSFADVAELVQPWGYALYRKTGAARFVPVTDPSGIEDALLLPEGAPAPVRKALGLA